MPDEEGTTEGQELQQTTEPPAEGAEQPAASTPEPAVSPEQWQQMQAQVAHLAGQNQLLAQQLQQVGMQAPAQPQQPEKLTDAAIQKLVDDGKGVEAMRMLAAEQAREAVAPLEQTGTNAIQHLTRQVATQTLPHYQQYQDEIDAYIGEVARNSPGAMLNPDIYKLAHNFVVGQHVDDIVEQRVQERLRAKAAPVGDAAPAQGKAPGSPDGVPTPQELFKGNDEVVQSLEQKGGPDVWAQSIGYADWADYVKQTEVNEEWGA